MEKKTIGKFIAALRKANGMTQRELGDKLCVSDKTVSRWECDECTPELALIPVIAEIFGITTDELLRGERSNPDRENAGTEESSARQKAKSEKQFRLLLDKKQRKYGNLTLIAGGISLIGFVAALIANFACTAALAAFCIMLGCTLISELCQIIFARNARTPFDDEEPLYTDAIGNFNVQVTRSAVRVSFLNIGLLLFCFPLAILVSGSNWGLQFDTWSGYGLIFVAFILPICYMIYDLIVKKALHHRGSLELSEGQLTAIRVNRRLLKKLVIVFVIVAMVLGISGVVVERWVYPQLPGYHVSYTFDSVERFTELVEAQFDAWWYGQYNPKDRDGNSLVTQRPTLPTDADEYEKLKESLKTYGQIRNEYGLVICEYYYNPDLYESITFTETSADQMPVTIVSKEIDYSTWDIFRNGTVLAAELIVVDFAAALAIYLLRSRSNKKRYAA